MDRSEREHLVLLETNIDDMNPEYYQYIMQRLFDGGALDVFLTPIIMKKERPAVKLSVLCEPDSADAMKDIVFRETTTFGIRIFEIQREKLDRSFAKVSTSYGEIKVKNGFLKGELVKSVPEYEDVKKAAAAHGVPIGKVYDEVIKVNLEQRKG
ncbi:nickel pincer cofactor biosynthesis protein LarC2 [Caldanaerobius polysaccharolyticus]|uniref:nickel insertion protein n=1 Tax=Caldanaerobius polysaccharolyticus TaxID=44256 RepID=UPI000478F73B|nr:nickel insertion protein [Caldanaerobius polysaccharolyticus]